MFGNVGVFFFFPINLCYVHARFIRFEQREVNLFKLKKNEHFRPNFHLFFGDPCGRGRFICIDGKKPFFGGFLVGFFSSFFVGVSLTLRELCRVVFGSFRGFCSFEGGGSPSLFWGGVLFGVLGRGGFSSIF